MINVTLQLHIHTSTVQDARWFCKFLPRVMTRMKKWSVNSASHDARIVEFAKEKMLGDIKEKANITLERLNKGGHSGTTTTGNTGRDFFSNKLVPVLEALVPENDVPANVLMLHRKLSVVLRVISSDAMVDIIAYENFIKEIGLLLAEHFSWAKLNFTLHASLHHSAELMKDNSNRGLGTLSEEALESNNKDLRRFMETLSRKFSGKLQLSDVITRALERSNPLIQDIILSFKKPLYCTLCHRDDHMRRSCTWKHVSPTDDKLTTHMISYLILLLYQIECL